MRLQPCPARKQTSIPGDCFTEPVGWDLIDEESEKKIAGAAMKRSRQGILLQGTIAFIQKWKVQKEELRLQIIQNLSEFVQENRVEYANWPDSFVAERKEMVEWFCSLDWKGMKKNLIFLKCHYIFNVAGMWKKIKRLYILDPVTTQTQCLQFLPEWMGHKIHK